MAVQDIINQFPKINYKIPKAPAAQNPAPSTSSPTYYTSKYGTKINTTGITGKPLTKIQSLADSKYGTKAQALAQKQRLMIPKVGPPLTVAPTTETPAATQPAAATTPSTAAPGTPETLFPSTRMFEPENYQGSPLYQFQLKEGQKQVAKSLAARGLTNSGRGIEEELDVPLRGFL